MLRSAQQDTEREARRCAERFPRGVDLETQDLSSFLDQYRPMLRLLSTADLDLLKHHRHSDVRRFRRERTAIYYQYLGDLCHDLRALPLWTAPNDAEALKELDKASWMVEGMLAKLALEGLLYYFGIRRRDSLGVERCFERLGTLLSAAV